MGSHHPHRWFWIALVVMVVLGFPGGCQKEAPTRSEPSPPSGTEVRIGRVEVDRTLLAPGDSAVVRAWVISGPDPGAPVPAERVQFSELQGRQTGTFSKVETLTDSQGWASSVFRSTGVDTGLVTLKAVAGSDTKYVNLRITRGSPPPADQTVLTVTTANGATSLAADGNSTLEITVRATRGPQATPVAGVTVVLAAGDRFVDVDGNGVFSGNDQLAPGGDLNGNSLWDPEGVVPERVTTDAQGQAVFTYGAGTGVGTVYLKMTGGGVSVDFALEQHPLTLRVRLETGVREVLADGVTTTPVSVRVQDWAGQAIQGVVVKLVAGEAFTDSSRDGYYTAGEPYEDSNENGRWDSIGEITSVVTTGFDGTALADYHAGLTPGDVTLRGTTSTSYGETTLKLLSIPPVQGLHMAMDRSSVAADPDSTVPGILALTDVNGGPLAGKSVHLVSGERFDDVNADGVFTQGTDQLLDDLDGDGSWTAMGLVPAAVITGEGGQARFVYTADAHLGDVWIRAAAEGISTEVSIHQRAPLTGPPSFLVCMADSVRLSAYSSCTVSALVYDENHNAVRDGTVVTFRADEGLIIGEGGIPSAGTLNGKATVIYQAVPGEGEGDGLAVITARTQGEVTCTSNIEVPVQSTQIARLSLNPELPEIGVRGTGAVEQTRVTARGFDAFARPVGAGRWITFSIVLGPGGGEEFVGQANPAVMRTDAAGYASVVLGSGTVSGTVLVKAEAEGGASEHTPVGIAAGPPESLAVGIQFCNVEACDRINVENGVTALAWDRYHNPVRDGTVIYFTTSEGMMVGNEGLGNSVIHRGEATATWRSTGGCANVTVTASTHGGDKVAETSFIASGAPYYTSFVVPGVPEVSCAADGLSQVSLRLLVLDYNSLFVVKETELQVEAVYGSILNLTKTDDGCNGSISDATYQSSVLRQDYSVTTPDDGIGAVDEVSAYSGFGPGVDTLLVQLRTSAASAANSELTINSSVDRGTEAYFTATVKDRYGNPLGGHVLNFFASKGTVEPSGTSDTWGVVGPLLYTAPPDSGSATLRVVDTDPGYKGDMILSRQITIN